MKTITIKKPFTFEGVIIPQGWKMDIPSFEIPLNDAALLRYSRSYQRFGANPRQGLEIAVQASVRVFEVAWVRLVKASVGYWAKEYETTFGDALGYDASQVAREFVPYDPRAWGRRGKAGMKKLLVDMRRRVT